MNIVRKSQILVTILMTIIGLITIYFAYNHYTTSFLGMIVTGLLGAIVLWLQQVRPSDNEVQQL